MIEKLALAVALCFSLSLNAYQWWSGQEKYVAGRTYERTLWEDKIRSKNAELEALGARATAAEGESARLRTAAAGEVLNTPMSALPPEIVAQCSYTEAVRAAMNRIR